MVSRSGWGRKAVFVLAAVAILTLSFSVLPASAVPFDEADFNGYATGNDLYIDALSSGTGADEIKLANVTEAFTGAAVDSRNIEAIHNEMNRLVAPAGKKTYGRGSGVELGIQKAPDDVNDLTLEIAEASAPPDSVDSHSLLEVPLSPVLYADTLRGRAEANWSSDETCVLGKDLSNGLGFAEDAQILETGTTNADGTMGAPLVASDAPNPERRVAQTFSHTFLDVQQNTAGAPIGLKFGLSSEVRETIAPVTLFKGTPNQLTIEVAGEWILRSTAGGINGSAHNHYGVGEVGTQTPLLRVLDVDNDILGQINLHDFPIIPPEGLILDIPGVISIAIGEDMRAIGDPADPESSPTALGNGTLASAAVDVVRVTALDGALADIRVGHMETKAQVPLGGIDCGIPVSKTARPPSVTVGQNFVVTIKVENPFNCDMTQVVVRDDITTTGGARFRVVSTNPPANTVPGDSNLDSGTIIWNNPFPNGIPAMSFKLITVTLQAQGSAGIIEDIANVSSTLAGCEGEGDGQELVGKSLPLRVPVSTVLDTDLPPTGVGTTGTAALGALMLLSLAGVTIRQIRRTKV